MKFRNLSIRSRVLMSVIGILTLLAIGIELFTLRYLKFNYESNLKNFAANISGSIAIAIRNDFTKGNIYGLDRFFMSFSQEKFKGLLLESCFLLDNKNRIIADLNPENFGMKFHNKVFIEKINANESEFFYENNEHQYVVSIHPVFSKINRVGYLILSLGTDRARSNYKHLLVFSLLVSVGFILLLGLLLFRILNNLVIVPLNELVSQANVIASGNFESQINYPGINEVASLSAAFDKMRKNILLDRQQLKDSFDEVEKSEKKYKLLARSFQDVVVILDSDFKIVHANSNLYKLFGVHSNGDISIAKLVYEKDNTNFESGIFIEKIKEVYLTGKASSFNANLISRYNEDPIEYKLNVEKIGEGDASEVLVRIYPKQADAIAPFIKKERISLEVGNSLVMVDEISSALTRHLAHIIDSRQIMQLELGVKEMLINAIEHGNLDISFNEKTRALENANYLEFISEKQRDARYKNRTITIDYILDLKKIVIRISDMGDGFDHKAHLAKKVEENILEHGRGINMTDMAFDRIVYNERGNSVTLVKWLPKN